MEEPKTHYTTIKRCGTLSRAHMIRNEDILRELSAMRAGLEEAQSRQSEQLRAELQEQVRTVVEGHSERDEERRQREEAEQAMRAELVAMRAGMEDAQSKQSAAADAV